MALKLTMTCGPYDRARALIDGNVKPEDIDLAITVNDDDVERQRQAARGDFDICEFFMGTYIADLPLKKLGFTAIPIFVKRMFRHSYIYINTRRGIRKPADLNGKRVGLQTWITSAALWAKGMLEEDHGVDLASIEWVAWQPVRIAGWQAPEWLKLRTAPAGCDQFELLARGEIDAGITTEIWAPNRHRDIDFLFPDYGAREREYFRRTRCFPIMHVLLIRDAMLRQNPWVARSLFDAWEASKQKTLLVAGLAAHSHDIALVSRSVGRGARRRWRRHLSMGLRQDPPRGRRDAALRPSPGGDAAPLPAGGVVLAVDA
jgi:4,5-dihydroxyphthalate decarboxylase